MIQNKPKELSYYYHPYDIVNWLDSDPNEEDVSYNDRQKKFQKFEVIKAKLDQLCPDNWDIKNFHHFTFFTNDRKQWVSGNIDLVVRYHYELQDGSGVREVYRTLSGSATFCTEDYNPNTHYGATCKSLCIANAAMLLGRQFSWGLNPDEEEPDLFSGPVTKHKIIRSGKPSVKMKPDKVIREKYAKAVVQMNNEAVKELESIYDFTIQ
jgi:hypothetical protein